MKIFDRNKKRSKLTLKSAPNIKNNKRKRKPKIEHIDLTIKIKQQNVTTVVKSKYKHRRPIKKDILSKYGKYLNNSNGVKKPRVRTGTTVRKFVRKMRIASKNEVDDNWSPPNHEIVLCKKCKSMIINGEKCQKCQFRVSYMVPVHPERRHRQLK